MKRIILLALLSLAATGAFAQSLSYTTIVRGMVDSDLQERYFENDSDLKEVSVVGSTGNALARAQIAPGVSKTFAHWDSLVSSTPAEILMSDAQTYWTDVVTISDPNLDGTLGTFTASLLVFGSATFELTGGYASGDIYSDTQVYGFWDSWIGTSTDGGGSFLVGGWFGDWYSDEYGEIWYEGDELNQPMTEVTLEFIYGQPFLLRMNLESYFDADNPNLLEGTVQGTLDFSHSAYWNGMGGIFDSNGNLVNPTFSSESGIDWRNAYGAAPEPVSFFGMGVGLGLTALLRRRKQ